MEQEETEVTEKFFLPSFLCYLRFLLFNPFFCLVNVRPPSPLASHPLAVQSPPRSPRAVRAHRHPNFVPLFKSEQRNEGSGRRCNQQDIESDIGGDNVTFEPLST